MGKALIVAAFLASALAPAAVAQTYGQLYHHAPSVTYGQPHGQWGGGLSEWDGRSYAATGRAATGYVNGPALAYGGYGQSYGHSGQGYGDPYAYRPPSGGYGYGHDRGGRYGYSTSNRWTRWSSPPGRGYHDAYGYNDDRAPRGPDHRRYDRDCYCGVGPYLYDR